MSNVIFSNRYLAERQFRDTLFSRKSFSQIVILSNVFFPNRYLGECHFSESSFNRTSFSRNRIGLLLLLIRNSYDLLNNTVSIRKIT